MAVFFFVWVRKMGVEYELKYASSEEAQAGIRQFLGGQWMEWRMRTTHYDTPGGTLASRKWTLRHRLENDTHICTLKTPAGDACGEWEVECPQIELAIEKLCKLDAPAELAVLTQNGVQPVCGAQFTRLASTVSGNGGVVEVALDRGILFAGRRQESLCEVEVELKSGSREAADAFAGELAERFGLKILKASKFKRALALRENT